MKQTLVPYHKLELVQGSDEWKAERRKYITASNVPALFGLSPYKTKLQYFEELTTGAEESISDAKQALFDIGHSAEAAGREHVEGMYGAAFPPAVVVSALCPELLASLDGFNEDHEVIYESKYVGREVILKIREAQSRGETWLPPHHECQIQAQLLATGAKKCIYFALDPDGEAAVVEVLPNRDYMRDIQDTVTLFMRDLHDGKAPEPSERDFHTPADERFKTLAELKQIADKAAADFDEMKAKLAKEYEQYTRIRAGGVVVTRTVTKGSIQYAKVPQLKNIDLEKYRGPSRVSVTVRLDKKGAANE